MDPRDVDRAVDFILAVHRDDRREVRRMTQAWNLLERPMRLVLADFAPLAIGALETVLHAGFDGDRLREDGLDRVQMSDGPGHLGIVLGEALRTWGSVSYTRGTPIGIARALLSYLTPTGRPEQAALGVLELLRSSLKKMTEEQTAKTAE
jgi:hypothetical protein